MINRVGNAEIAAEQIRKAIQRLDIRRQFEPEWLAGLEIIGQDSGIVLLSVPIVGRLPGWVVEDFSPILIRAMLDTDCGSRVRILFSDPRISGGKSPREKFLLRLADSRAGAGARP